MKVLKIINSGLNSQKLFKMNKFTSEADKTVGRGNVESLYSNKNLFNIERGTINDRDNQLVTKIKTEVIKILDTLNNKKHSKETQKLEWYKNLLIDPKHNNHLTFYVNNPRIRAISASVKSNSSEEYLDLIIHGYSKSKERYLINREGEIIKIPTIDFLRDAKIHAYDADSVYFAQHEINNLGMRRYLDLYDAEIEKLHKYMQNEEPKIVKKQPEISQYFWEIQIKKCNDVYQKFNKLYYGIDVNSTTYGRKKTFADICGIKLDKTRPIMEIDNLKNKGQNVLINIIEKSEKPAIRIRLYENNYQTKMFVILDGHPVEETNPPVEENLFKLGKIIKYYSPAETEENNIPQLLNAIEERLDKGQKKLRAMIGKKADNI